MTTPITVNHPDLGTCKILKRSTSSTYIRMPSGRCFLIPRNEPERTRAINFVKEDEERFFSEWQGNAIIAHSVEEITSKIQTK